MSKITTKTRKIIWSKSGGSCAICKQELTKKVDEKHLVLGQECHIRSSKTNGPRYDSNFPKDKFDAPENLILLCRNHHKEIDDFPLKYSIESLIKIKNDHEVTIHNRSSQEIPQIKVIQSSKYLPAVQITSGMQLIDMASGAAGFAYAFDETEDDEIYGLIKDLLSYVEDLDIISDVSQSSKLDMARELKMIMNDLENHGYFVFGAVANDKITGGVSPDAPWRTIYYTLTTKKEIKYIARA